MELLNNTDKQDPKSFMDIPLIGGDLHNRGSGGGNNNSGGGGRWQRGDDRVQQGPEEFAKRRRY